MSLAKEFDVCPDCGTVIANDEMHADFHAWIDSVNDWIDGINQLIAQYTKQPPTPRPPKPVRKDY